MESNLNQNIHQTIGQLKKQGYEIHRKKTISSAFYTIEGNNYKITVLVNPAKWLGLTFVTLNKDKKVQFSYDIDTDLYDISKAEHQKFSKDIEDEIVGFLRAFSKAQLKVGKHIDKPALIIPTNEGFVLITKGRFLTANQHPKDIQKVESNGTFAPFIPL